MAKLTPLFLAVAMAGLMVAPARAGFCGVPDDIKPVVKLTIATYPKISPAKHAIDETYIRILSVNGTYAYSVTDEGTRSIPFYWEKPTGTWRLAGANRAPSDWPKPLLAFFQSEDSCNNPDWKNHS